MANGLRWSAEQLQLAQARMGKVPRAVAPVASAAGNMSGVDIDAVHRKFGNRKVERNGVVYDSKHESQVLADLEVREKAGEIRDLRRQVPFAIVINDIHVCDYVADAVYLEGKRRVVVDAKSAHTRTLPVYRIKKKLMAAVLGIEIREV